MKQNTDSSIYYNGGELLSKQRLFNYVVGNRGGGKSFYWKEKCIRDFLNKGEEFIWTRRYQSEIKDTISQWADDIQFKFEGHKFECGKKYIKIDGKICGYVGSLSRANVIKSVPYPRVTKIILDEFIIDKGTLRYLPNEGEIFCDLVETIFRMRDEGHCAVCIGNAISIVNPHFLYWKLKPKLDKRFTLEDNEYDSICIEMYTNEEFIKEKLKTRFGRAMMKKEYGKYSIENKFLRDNNSFLRSRGKKLVYAFSIVYEGVRYGVWNNFDDGSMYIDKVVEKNNDKILVVDMMELTEQCKFKKWQGWNVYLSTIKILFNEGQIFYDDIQTKHKMFEVIKMI